MGKLFSRVLFLLLIGSVGFFLAGCGGSQGGSLGSGAIGLTDGKVENPIGTVKILPVNTRISPSEATGIAVQVSDSNGNPANGTPVTLSSLLGGTFEPASGDTAKGWFYSRFTAGSLPGTENITALALGNSATASLQIVVKDVATPTIKLFLGAETTTPGTPVTVAVYGTQAGQPSNDVSVVLGSSHGGEFKETLGTFSKGWFTTTFTPGADPVSSVITANVLGITASATLKVSIASAPTRLISVNANPDAIYTGQSSVVVVQVTDALGNPADANVVMASSLDGSFVPPSGDSKDGIFYSTFTAAEEVGSCTISALYFGKSASDTISIYKPKLKTTISTASDRIKRNSTKNPLTVFVSNDLNSPVPKANVLLSGTLGIVFEAESGTADEQGYFSTYFTAPNASGACTITAMSQDGLGSLTVTIW